MKDGTIVVGAGVAGLGVAHELARRGHPVTILDARPQLGGHAAEWACMATDRCWRCGVCRVHDLAAAVGAAPTVRTLLRHRVTRIARVSGRHRVEAVGPDEKAVTLEAPAVVLATGFEPFAPAGARPLGNEAIPGAVTTVALNEALRAHDLDRLGFAGGPRKRIAFLQCVGSRDPEAGRPYCSQVCCEGTLRFARRLRHLRPDWEVTVFYIDLQVTGKEARARFSSLAPEIRMVQGVPAEIRPVADPSEGSGTVAYQGPDGKMHLETFDGFVMAVGMVAPRGTRDLVSGLGGVQTTTGGFLRLASPEAPGLHVVGTAQGPATIEGCLLQARQVAAAVLAERARPADYACAPLVQSIEPQPMAFATDAPAASPRSAEDSEPVTVERTVAVLGDGAEARLLSDALAQAGLPVRRLPARAADGGPAWARLLGTAGRFTLRPPRSDAPAAGAPPVTAGAVILAPGLELAEPLPAPAGPGPEVCLPEQVRGEASWALWLDPDGPAWRPTAGKALEAATQGAEAGEEVSVLARHVPLPGLAGQERYDALRAAGVRVVRLEEARPKWEPQQNGPALRLLDAAAPETPALLRVEKLAVVPLPRPPADLAAALSIARDREGFAQSAEVRLEPIATHRAGLFAFGSARGEALEDDLRAEAAALALEIRALLGAGEIQWPKAPIEIHAGRCIRCLTCVRACPHGALAHPPTPGAPPRPEALSCAACGQCVAVCPARAILPRGAAEPPPRERPQGLAPPESRLVGSDPSGRAPRVVVFACRHGGAPALRHAVAAGSLPTGGLHAVEVPCGGAVEETALLQALRAGARRVALLTCHPGACAHHRGPERIRGRIAELANRLATLGLPRDTVTCLPVAPAEGARLASWLRPLVSPAAPPSQPGPKAAPPTEGATP